MNRITKLLIGMMLIGPITPCAAMSLGDIGSDIYAQSKVTFLDKAQLGWGYNLRHLDSDGGPMALLNFYEYRFFIASIGWADPANRNDIGAPAVLAGIHVDKLVRLIAPETSDMVKAAIPSAIRPFYDKLTISWGPGYDAQYGEWTSFVAANLQFGD